MKNKNKQGWWNEFENLGWFTNEERKQKQKQFISSLQAKTIRDFAKKLRSELVENTCGGAEFILDKLIEGEVGK